jgi:DNA-binding MarR family transcriptional regulator
VAVRWTPTLIRSGHIPVARTFLRNYSSLNPPLTPTEALFVIHLMDFKWDEKAPYPGYKTLAKHMGVSPKMVRRYAQALETKGYLKRELRTSQTNLFELSPLFKALEDRVLQENRTSQTRQSRISRALPSSGNARRSKVGNRHVVPNPGGGWDIVAPNAERASGHFDTQREAEQRAKEIVSNDGGGEVRIHDRHGRIRDSDTVAPGNDPSPPKDRKH